MIKYEFKTFDKVNPDGTQSKVVMAISTYRGRTVKGMAKCTERDVFSFEDGKKLSSARCAVKVYKKKRKRAATKCAEALKNLELAKKNFMEMTRYYNEVTEEYADSLNKLEEIESTLK
jgi:hypothetical protein